MKRIPLTQNKFALVDDSDFTALSKFRWHAKSSGKTWRPARGIRCNRKQFTILMYRQILGFPAGQIDHANGNALDNRRCNLRLANPSQQAANSSRNYRHGFRGIKSRYHRWIATITIHNRSVYLGSFATKEQAARKYDQAAKSAFGNFAVLNFPNE